MQAQLRFHVDRAAQCDGVMQKFVAGGGPAFAINGQGIHKGTPDVISAPSRFSLRGSIAPPRQGGSRFVVRGRYNMLNF